MEAPSNNEMGNYEEVDIECGQISLKIIVEYLNAFGLHLIFLYIVACICKNISYFLFTILIFSSQCIKYWMILFE